MIEGKAGAFTNTERLKVNDDTGAVETTLTHDVTIKDEDGRSVTLRNPKPWNIRPGEWVRIRLERTQRRLDEEDGA